MYVEFVTIFSRMNDYDLPHALGIGDEVVAKFDAYRGKDDDPWFSGIVADIDDEEGICTVNFCDGDVSVELSADEVLFAPGRAEDFGKGSKRGATPDSAMAVRIGAIEWRKGHEVVAKFHSYRGKADNPWFSGTVAEVDEEEGTCIVNFCDGDVSICLNETEVLFAPGRAEDFGKGDKRGATPDNAVAVRIGAGPKGLMHVENEEELEALVREKGVICIFSASWCSPCQRLKKKIADAGLDRELVDYVHFAVVDVDECKKSLKRRFDVTSMPTTIFLKKGSGLEPFRKEINGISRGMLNTLREIAPQLSG
ncbi:unnamed protein product [Amoebophrya sp. A25]|nr:unnamed protein product [Amoebophrya sp. A25]|eukprot:GSA25T00017471001.1